jgi:4-aminobutyrate aminotransferase-like enzyme
MELAERLLATMPPAAGLDTVMLVNSGSEANDLAWRIATAATGSLGAIVTQHAYHGVTEAIAALSPEEWPPGYRPPHVTRIPVPSLETGKLERLAATFLDCGLTSDGIWIPEAADVAALVDATHAAGGLFVTDEVQAGYGRFGEHLWSFEHYGVTPDIVTLGKPMGNGYPVAAVVTRREVVERFPFAGEVFSTFGGNPVAARAALAVLDVIEDERLLDHVAQVGSLLLSTLAELAEVRGRGLLVGVQRESADEARRIVDRLRERGILIGRTGPRGDVLKIRPPLVFGEEHVTLLADALRGA